MTATDVFLDTAYAIALSSPKDEHHDKAVELAEQLESTLADFSQGRGGGKKYPPIAMIWKRQWEQVIPFFPIQPR